MTKTLADYRPQHAEDCPCDDFHHDRICSCGLSDLLASVERSGEQQVEEKKEDHGAELIHQPIPTVEETEPRPNGVTDESSAEIMDAFAALSCAMTRKDANESITRVIAAVRADERLKQAIPDVEGTPELLHDVTSIEVIDETGRCYTRWHTKIAFSYQDDGRTLKIFVDPSNPSDAERDRVVGGSLVAGVRQVRASGMAAADSGTVQGVDVEGTPPPSDELTLIEQLLEDRVLALIHETKDESAVRRALKRMTERLPSSDALIQEEKKNVLRAPTTEPSTVADQRGHQQADSRQEKT